VNLGDSGFVVVRDGRTVLRSPSQQHDFNFTYQLESGGGSDLPSSAQASNSAPSFSYFVENNDNTTHLGSIHFCICRFC
jgi:hypothetical protein